MTTLEKQISLGLRPASYVDQSTETWEPIANAARVKYVNKLREIVARRMPRNRCGVPIVSDVDLLLADEWEIAEALGMMGGKKK